MLCHTEKGLTKWFFIVSFPGPDPGKASCCRRRLCVVVWTLVPTEQ